MVSPSWVWDHFRCDGVLERLACSIVFRPPADMAATWSRTAEGRHTGQASWPANGHRSRKAATRTEKTHGLWDGDEEDLEHSPGKEEQKGVWRRGAPTTDLGLETRVRHSFTLSFCSKWKTGEINWQGPNKWISNIVQWLLYVEMSP